MILRFGRCEFDLARVVLRRDGDEVRIEPQAFDLLAYLVAAPRRDGAQGGAARRRLGRPLRQRVGAHHADQVGAPGRRRRRQPPGDHPHRPRQGLRVRRRRSRSDDADRRPRRAPTATDRRPRHRRAAADRSRRAAGRPARRRWPTTASSRSSARAASGKTSLALELARHGRGELRATVSTSSSSCASSTRTPTAAAFATAIDVNIRRSSSIDDAIVEMLRPRCSLLRARQLRAPRRTGRRPRQPHPARGAHGVDPRHEPRAARGAGEQVWSVEPLPTAVRPGLDRRELTDDPGGGAVRRTGARRRPRLRARRRDRTDRRRDLPPARRHPARDRAGRGAGACARRRRDRAPARRALRAAEGDAPRQRSSPPRDARRDQLVLRPARARRAGAVRRAVGVRRVVRPRRGRGGLPRRRRARPADAAHRALDAHGPAAGRRRRRGTSCSRRCASTAGARSTTTSAVELFTTHASHFAAEAVDVERELADHRRGGTRWPRAESSFADLRAAQRFALEVGDFDDAFALDRLDPRVRDARDALRGVRLGRRSAPRARRRRPSARSRSSPASGPTARGSAASSTPPSRSPTRPASSRPRSARRRAGWPSATLANVLYIVDEHDAGNVETARQLELAEASGNDSRLVHACYIRVGRAQLPRASPTRPPELVGRAPRARADARAARPISRRPRSREGFAQPRRGRRAATRSSPPTSIARARRQPVDERVRPHRGRRAARGTAATSTRAAPSSPRWSTLWYRAGEWSQQWHTLSRCVIALHRIGRHELAAGAGRRDRGARDARRRADDVDARTTSRSTRATRSIDVARRRPCRRAARGAAPPAPSTRSCSARNARCSHGRDRRVRRPARRRAAAARRSRWPRR